VSSARHFSQRAGPRLQWAIAMRRMMYFGTGTSKRASGFAGIPRNSSGAIVPGVRRDVAMPPERGCRGKVERPAKSRACRGGPPWPPVLGPRRADARECVDLEGGSPDPPYARFLCRARRSAALVLLLAVEPGICEFSSPARTGIARGGAPSSKGPSPPSTPCRWERRGETSSGPRCASTHGRPNLPRLSFKHLFNNLIAKVFDRRTCGGHGGPPSMRACLALNEPVGAPASRRPCFLSVSRGSQLSNFQTCNLKRPLQGAGNRR
jgi:hypothetical protein